MRRIAVTALSDGWRVSLDDLDNDMVFRSGREAERAARKLAARLAQAGVRCEIRLHLKDGALAAKFVCPAALPAGANDNIGAAAPEPERAHAQAVDRNIAGRTFAPPQRDERGVAPAS